MMQAHASLVQTNPGPARPRADGKLMQPVCTPFVCQQYKVMFLHTSHTEEWYLLQLEFSSVAIS